MLIAIAIAEEIQGLKRIELVPELSGGPPGLHAQNNSTIQCEHPQTISEITSREICSPWISSAMAMAMSIYRTLCVLVFLISLLEMFIAFGNKHLIFLKISLLEMLIAFGNEHLDFF